MGFPYMTPIVPDREVKGAANQAMATDFWVSSIRVPFSIDQRRGEEQRSFGFVSPPPSVIIHFQRTRGLIEIYFGRG